MTAFHQVFRGRSLTPPWPLFRSINGWVCALSVLIWDRLFGSASKTQRTAAMKIGVEGASDRPLFELAIKPFSV